MNDLLTDVTSMSHRLRKVSTRAERVSKAVGSLSAEIDNADDPDELAAVRREDGTGLNWAHSTMSIDASTLFAPDTRPYWLSSALGAAEAPPPLERLDRFWQMGTRRPGQAPKRIVRPSEGKTAPPDILDDSPWVSATTVHSNPGASTLLTGHSPVPRHAHPPSPQTSSCSNGCKLRSHGRRKPRLRARHGRQRRGLLGSCDVPSGQRRKLPRVRPLGASSLGGTSLGQAISTPCPRAQHGLRRGLLTVLWCRAVQTGCWGMRPTSSSSLMGS